MNRYDQDLAERRLLGNPEQVRRIPGMGICLDKFNQKGTDQERRELERELNIPPGSKLVLSIAYLIPAKGIYVYFQAANALARERDDVHFLIAGNGPHEHALETTVHVSQMTYRFSVLGWRNDIDRLMRCADIFVLPTFYFEGLPVSILEAMACGKPVIATCHRGCEDAVVDKETGYLVPTQDAQALADQLRVLLDDPEQCQRMGQAGRKRVETVFELEHCTRLMADGLDELMNRGELRETVN